MFSIRELKVVALAVRFGRRIQLTRKSDREFDIELSGQYPLNPRAAADGDEVAAAYVDFTGWLPLAAIRELTAWTSKELAAMTDYPDMVTEGDWSGVRDTGTERLWLIFDRFIVTPWENRGVIDRVGRPGAGR